MKMKRNKLLARLIALHGVRNTDEFEQLHRGIVPSSKTGDFSDVKVVSPYGEIPWNELSRFSNAEMRPLMLAIEKNICKVLDAIPHYEKEAGSVKEFEKALKETLWDHSFASWDKDLKRIDAILKDLNVVKAKPKKGPTKKKNS